MNLFLVGDDEALDVLAELSRHLDYFSVTRLDEVPSRPLGEKDHVLVALLDSRRALALLETIIAGGNPGFAALVPELPGMTTGARAIVAAARLVEALIATG
jgi:hypothetical protein